ncbi:MAG: tyrosine-type recombinase/integrase [Phycisphaerae bacterium]|jgi:integrase|nr:tyrosine-type recombinase/integrase [Phycisphaerae bacterium]
MKNRHSMVQQVQDYLRQRRALGFALNISGQLLMRFAEFADRLGHRGPLTTDLMLRWVNLPEGASDRYRAGRLAIVRAFARHLAAVDGRTEVPELRLLGPKPFRQQPHLYSDQQLQELMDAAGRLSPTYALRPRTYRTLFGLLASTGVRVSEALKLTRDHVDLVQGVLHIEQTKFHKSRLVPMHATTTRAMRRYAAARDRDQVLGQARSFFAGRYGRPLPYSTVRGVFQCLRRQLGWHSNGTLSRPRIHDLRHSFACRRLLQWYQQGINPHHAIAALSTYLGHGKVVSAWPTPSTRRGGIVA